jgi:hypothetical protein
MQLAVEQQRVHMMAQVHRLVLARIIGGPVLLIVALCMEGATVDLTVLHDAG